MKLLLWILILFLAVATKDIVEVTSINCIILDKTVAEFQNCRIIPNGTRKYIEVKIKLYMLPMENVTVKVQLMKNNNGLTPYPFSATIDACKFMKDRRKGLLSYFYSFVEPYSNMNHTCPYNHDILVTGAGTKVVRNDFLKYFPLPYGEYAVFTTWLVNGVPRIEVSGYGTYSHEK